MEIVNRVFIRKPHVERGFDIRASLTDNLPHKFFSEIVKLVLDVKQLLLQFNFETEIKSWELEVCGV
jgi:hypothetical protein